MTNNILLNGFLFRQMFIVVLLHQRIFRHRFYGEWKAKWYQTNNQTTEIKETIHIIIINNYFIYISFSSKLDDSACEYSQMNK